MRGGGWGMEAPGDEAGGVAAGGTGVAVAIPGGSPRWAPARRTGDARVLAEFGQGKRKPEYNATSPAVDDGADLAAWGRAASVLGWLSERQRRHCRGRR